MGPSGLFAFFCSLLVVLCIMLGIATILAEARAARIERMYRARDTLLRDIIDDQRLLIFQLADSACEVDGDTHG